jgi:suppressor of fused protein SUFU
MAIDVEDILKKHFEKVERLPELSGCWKYCVSAPAHTFNSYIWRASDQESFYETTIRDYDYISMGGPITKNGSPDMTGFVFALDPQSPEIQTQNGSVKFVQVICVTTDELRWIENSGAEAITTLYAQNNPLLVSDVSRNSIVGMA